MYPIQVSPDDNKEVSNGEYSVLIQGLIPGTTYQCTVYANTSKGAGPEAVVIRRTFEESELMCNNYTLSSLDKLHTIVLELYFLYYYYAIQCIYDANLLCLAI